MAKVRTLSRQFLHGHPKKGQPTYFVEKFLNAMKVEYRGRNYLQLLQSLNPEVDVIPFFESLDSSIKDSKLHTIRGGDHFKVGDFVSIRCWSGKPYKDKQIKLLPDIAVVKTYLFNIDNINYIEKVSYNDGLSHKDFVSWFPKKFNGQIICWVDPQY